MKYSYGTRYLFIVSIGGLLFLGCSDNASNQNNMDADGDGYTVAQGDCNDNDNTIHPRAQEIVGDGIDQDCDGRDLTQDSGEDQDKDGYTVKNGDCNDNDNKIHPGAADICGDGIDQDCDTKDLPCNNTIDTDGDGYSTAQGDCNDNDKAVNPGAKETPYNGKDDDCNSATKDDDLDGDGFTKMSGGDCNDNDASIHPGALEIPYDGIDQDCSGTDLTDVDHDGFDSITVKGGTDCDDTNPAVKPGGIEVCGDSLDQDCDGKDLLCSDTDLDKDGYSPNQGDCNDTDKTINPGAKETPYNGKDDDCNPATKEDDLDGDGFAKMGGGDCNDNDKTIFPGAKEIPYDSIDQDCSGKDLTDIDQDGFDSITVKGGTDCDDLNPAIRPNAPEIPFDTVDQNCDASDYVTMGSQVIVPSGGINQLDTAFNGTNYLVVYLDSSRNNNVYTYTIYGQFVTPAGAPLNKPVTIFSTQTNSPDGLSIASNGANFLVVWYQYTGSNYALNVQHVASNGTLINKPFTIRSSSSSSFIPRIAFENGVYAVVWREWISPNYIVYAQLLNASASLIGSPIQVYSIENTNGSIQNPTVASGGGVFLISWVYNGQSTNNYYDLLGRVLSSNGSLVGATFSVSSAPAYQYEPSLAYGGNFLSAWQDNRNGTYDIYGQRISGSGALLGTTADQNLPISVVQGNQQIPKITFCSGRFNVVWRDDRYAIGGTLFRQPLDINGQFLDGTTVDKNILVYANISSINNFDVICGGNRVFVPFLEATGLGSRIMGIVFAP